MKTFLVIIGLLALAIVIFVIYRLITVSLQNKKLNAQRFARIKPIYEKLKNDEPISLDEILPYAQNILTREATFQLLTEYNKTDLFPAEYNNLIKGAESNLANWLEFPTELDACPDELEHIKRVTFDIDGQEKLAHYEVFKYRVNEPHWAAKDGWILGVVGPYSDNSKPYDFPHATFSRISSTLEKISPEEEAKWVHENISLRR